MAKYFSSEAALENSIESMRIHGAYGYSKEYDIERLYRDAPLTKVRDKAITGGTEGVIYINADPCYAKR